MAIRRDLTKRFVSTVSPAIFAPFPPAGTSFWRTYVASPDIASRGFFQRILQRRAINQSSTTVMLPEFMTLPVGDKLREKLWEMSRLNGVSHIPANKTVDGKAMTVEDARKIMKAALVEKVKERLRLVSETAVSYSEFVQICSDACGSEHQGLDIAKLLDDSANVIIWGDVVFLRPEQVAKSMESLITESLPMRSDPRKKELDEMEKQKAQINKKAQSLVKRELYYGLGFLVAQTAVSMRLTFWELSWDVMEPICFFVTSLHFALAYIFYLRTSKEPSFEGYFGRRFRTKQAQLMKIHHFDIEKYERLFKAFYPSKNFDAHAHT